MFRIKTKETDGLLLEQARFIVLNSIPNKKKTIICKKLVRQSIFYDLPISSGMFCIFKSNGVLENEYSCVQPDEITNKVFAMPLENFMIYAPLRHACDNSR